MAQVDQLETALRSAFARLRRRVRARPREWAVNFALLCVVLALAADVLPLWAEVAFAVASLALIRFEGTAGRRAADGPAEPSGKAGLS